MGFRGNKQNMCEREGGREGAEAGEPAEGLPSVLMVREHM